MGILPTWRSLVGIPDALSRHNPAATIASRGCPVGCWFCIVPAMEGKNFTLIPDFPVRPILCDNNLSALDPKYQDHIVSRYVAEGVPLTDANSGFEPRTLRSNRLRPLEADQSRPVAFRLRRLARGARGRGGHGNAARSVTEKEACLCADRQ